MTVGLVNLCPRLDSKPRTKSARQYDKNGNRIVWAVPKALYGGKASGRYWYNHLRKWLLAHDFVAHRWCRDYLTRISDDGDLEHQILPKAATVTPRHSRG